jgi:hypothetical protein
LEISYLGERIGLKTPCISRCGHRYPFFCSFIACAPPAAVGRAREKKCMLFPISAWKTAYSLWIQETSEVICFVKQI